MDHTKPILEIQGNLTVLRFTILGGDVVFGMSKKEFLICHRIRF